MPSVLKVRCGGEVYRVFLEGDLAYETVAEAIEKVRPEGCQAARLVAKYSDEEGDLCTLCAATFDDFVSCCGNSSAPGQMVFKVQLVEQGAVLEAAPVAGCRQAGPSGLPACPPEPSQPSSSMACEQFEACPLIFEGLKRFMEVQWKEWKQEWRHGGSRAFGADADWYLRPEKVVWILARLRSAGALTGNMMASVVVQWLPKILSAAAENAREVDQRGCELLPYLRERHILEEVLARVRATPGMAGCERALAALLAGEAATPSEALLSLLVALDSMTFEEQVAFVAGLFESLEEYINEGLDRFDANCPAWMKGATLEHRFITCDGCGSTPLKGPRFQSKVLPNFDLCGECFAQKNQIQGGICAGHDFSCVVVDWLCKFKGGSPLEQLMKAVKGKGLWPKGKGKGCHWEKGHWEKGHWEKGKGKHKGCKGFDPYREMNWRAPFWGARSAEATQAAQPAHDSSSSGCGSSTSDSARSFPVEVEDGRRLVIAWNVGDDPTQVAADFAMRHGILPYELPAIVNFVRHAESVASAETAAAAAAQVGPASVYAQAMPPPPGLARDEPMLPPDGPDADAQAQALAEAGLGSVEAMRQLLRDHGGDPAKVLDELSK